MQPTFATFTNVIQSKQCWVMFALRFPCAARLRQSFQHPPFVLHIWRVLENGCCDLAMCERDFSNLDRLTITMNCAQFERNARIVTGEPITNDWFCIWHESVRSQSHLAKESAPKKTKPNYFPSPWPLFWSSRTWNVLNRAYRCVCWAKYKCISTWCFQCDAPLHK